MYMYLFFEFLYLFIFLQKYIFNLFYFFYRKCIHLCFAIVKNMYYLPHHTMK